MCVQFWTFFLLGRLFFDTKKHAKKKRKSERERKKKAVLLCARVGYIP